MKTVEDILHKEITRKEFLTTAGVGIISLFGMSAVLHLLLGERTHDTVGQIVNSDYGNSVYGGK